MLWSPIKFLTHLKHAWQGYQPYSEMPDMMLVSIPGSRLQRLKRALSEWFDVGYADWPSFNEWLQLRMGYPGGLYGRAWALESTRGRIHLRSLYRKERDDARAQS